MTQTQNRLSRLMRISWDIQRTKRKTRRQSLLAAWAICSNEDIAVQYLTQKLNRNKPLSPKANSKFGLFPQY